MELILNLIDFFIDLDQYLGLIIHSFGGWTYLIVFLVIFCETGLVVTPILPGDSLLFGLGYFASMGVLEVKWLLILLATAAVAGDNLNYWIGRFVGPRVFHEEESRFLRKEYLDRTHRFYERHGGKTIIIGRFIPIIRTFAPFVAGIGRMTYTHFLPCDIAGGIFWITIFILSGYWFGHVPVVKDNFTLVILAIIFISILPGVIEYLRQRSLEER